MPKVGSQIATKNKIVMISPTTSTDLLSNIDDYFSWVSTPSAVFATQYADYVYNPLDLNNMNAIYDLSNFFFSVGWFEKVFPESIKDMEEE